MTNVVDTLLEHIGVVAGGDSSHLKWARVQTLSPLTVRRFGESTDIAVTSSVLPPSTLAKNDRVILGHQGQTVILLASPDQYLRSQGLYVPWEIPNRQVAIGPDGDISPRLALRRSRPAYDAEAYMYLAGSSSSTELAFAIRDDGSPVATYRLTKGGMTLQDNVGPRGSRKFALEPALGVTTLSLGSANNATVRVSFPVGRFTSSDILNVQLTKGSGGLAKFIPYFTDLSATGMTVGIYSGDGSLGTGNVPIHWRVDTLS